MRSHVGICLARSGRAQIRDWCFEIENRFERRTKKPSEKNGKDKVKEFRF